MEDLLNSIRENIWLYDAEIARLKLHLAKEWNARHVSFLIAERNADTYEDLIKSYIALLENSRNIMKNVYQYLLELSKQKA